MDKESPTKALLVVTVTALVCSIMVSAAAVYLQPIQKAYEDLDRIRYIVQVGGLITTANDVSEVEIATSYRNISTRLIDLDAGAFDATRDPETFIGRLTADEIQQSEPVPATLDFARLGNRPRWMTVYISAPGSADQRLILPIYGQGMWSTLYGYLALEPDLNTIADIVFYEHGETPGIGDRIQNPAWLAGWRGKRLYDEQGQLRFNIGPTAANEGETAQSFNVDGIAGATVTVSGVANLVRYWFGPHGYAPLLTRLSDEGGL
jgi:Na+-transporting NADH:ubiquinone oxidoreductase subunit C